MELNKGRNSPLCHLRSDLVLGDRCWCSAWSRNLLEIVKWVTISVYYYYYYYYYYYWCCLLLIAAWITGIGRSCPLAYFTTLNVQTLSYNIFCFLNFIYIYIDISSIYISLKKIHAITVSAKFPYNHLKFNKNTWNGQNTTVSFSILIHSNIQVWNLIKLEEHLDIGIDFIR